MRNVLAGAAAGVAATVPMTMVMETLHERLQGEVPRPLPPREIAEGLAVKFGVHRDLSERDMQNLTLALWSDPSSGRLFARAAEVYAERRNALIEALAAHEIHARGRSGFNVWIPVREETTTVQALADRGWAVAAGERFRVQSPPAIRVTTSALPPAEATRFGADLAASFRQRGSVPA